MSINLSRLARLERKFVRPAPVERPPQARLLARTRTELRSEWQDNTAKLSMFDAGASRRCAEPATVDQIIAKLDATIALAAS